MSGCTVIDSASGVADLEVVGVFTTGLLGVIRLCASL